MRILPVLDLMGGEVVRGYGREAAGLSAGRQRADGAPAGRWTWRGRSARTSA